MTGLFKKIPIIVRFYTNEIEVIRLDKNLKLRRIAKYKFSTERLIIADFNNAEKLLSSMVKEILGNKRLFSPTLIMIIQQMVEFPDGISEIEKRAYRDLAEHAGAI
ncbi:hypothetical protein [Marinifilum fragile]|uniref:hypothetical protein n=1 Tax=Marinifilum fragile TaxID=570161 RepID=UPI002AA866AC|nr:hypothetical protein [Marinifilum fragile]